MHTREKNTFWMSLIPLLLFSTAVAQVGAQQTVVSVFPASYTVPEIGVTFVINVTIQDVNNLYGWELKLYYPNGILNGTVVTEGPLLKTGGMSTFFWVQEFTDSYNETHGRVWVSCNRVGAVPGVDGDGVLASITFNSTSLDGPSVLHLADVILGDPEATEIPCTSDDGEVTVVPEFPLALILPLFMASSTIAAILVRKKLARKPKNSSAPIFLIYPLFQNR